MSGTSDDIQFGRMRSYLWPIHRYELKKFIPMFLIFFFISLNYNIVRTMKDTLVVTAKTSGAEAIPFIKVWVMFPGSVLMAFLFTRLSNFLSREKVFYIIFSLFLGFYFLFTFLLYPNRDAIHPNQFADSLQQILPAGCKGLVALIRNWSFTLFYVASELWGNIIFFVLLWGFVNQVTRIQEAKRFYALFGFGANLSGIVAGLVSVFVCRSMDWDHSMKILMGIVLLSGFSTIALFRWMNKTVLKDPRYYDPEDHAEEQQIKGKLTLRENFAYLMQSKYLLYIAVIVISYNVVINLVEVIWKDQVRALYPEPGDFNLYINQVSTLIGVIATFTSLFISGNVIRKFGWTFTAMLAPFVLFLSSCLFFGFYIFQEQLSWIALSLFDCTPLMMIVTIGSLQNILCRGAKYTVFDATKEMAFVPLSVECKIKGKAAIDGVLIRLGKSTGSMIHQLLLLVFVSFSLSAPYVAMILYIIISGWMYVTKLLGREFSLLTSTKASALKGEESNSPTDPEYSYG